MKALHHTSISVAKLLRHLEDGVFALPRLQREFVWNGRKAAALIDSINRGMPIGAILVWDTSHHNQNVLRKSLHILPQYDPANDRIWFLVDGQQRVSVLYQAAHGEVRLNSDGREVDFSRLVLNLYGNGKDEASISYRRAVAQEHAELPNILSPAWRYRFRRFPNYKLNRIEKCRERIRKYRVPVIFVQTNDLSEVQEVFVRINSLGTPIGSADRVMADVSKFDIRGLAHEAQQSLAPEFRQVPYETVLQAFGLVAERKVTDVGERAYESSLKKWEKRADESDSHKTEFHRIWRRLQTALGKSVDYLKENSRVLSEGFLPSANMLATLSVFFYHHPAQPTTYQRREIRKWFWATGVAQRYSGRGYRQNILADVGFFRRLASGRGRFTLKDRADRLDVRKAEYTRRSSLTDSFYCLLACQEPRYIENGQPVPDSLYASAANRKHRHHIFPRAMLAVYGFNHHQYNSICNICFVVADEHGHIGAKSPRTYLAKFRRKKHFARAMRSHLIPCDGRSAIWTKGVRRAFKQFVPQRLAAICRAFEREAGIKLFRKD